MRPCACVAPNDNNYIFYAWRAPATDRRPALYTKRAHTTTRRCIFLSLKPVQRSPPRFIGSAMRCTTITYRLLLKYIRIMLYTYTRDVKRRRLRACRTRARTGFSLMNRAAGFPFARWPVKVS